MGFRYISHDGTTSDRFRHFMSYESGEVYAGSFTIPAAVGSVSVTGLGFQPDALLTFATSQPGFSFFDNGLLHIGATDGTNQWTGGLHWPDLPAGGTTTSSVWKDDRLMALSFNSVLTFEVEITSLDVDGFTVNTLTAAGGDQKICYLAFRGAYKVGTAQVPGATGLQSITGLGFQPTAVWMASAEIDDLTLIDTSRAKLTMGGGTIDDGQWNVWAGQTAGDLYNNEAEVAGKILTLWQDAQAAGPFQPAVNAEAELVSLDADGFTLDWTTVDGNAYYYSWFATGEDAHAGRWTYNHTGVELGVVDSPGNPIGLLFFCNDMGLEGSLPEFQSGGASIAIGAWADNGVEFAAAIDSADQPAFSAPVAVREQRNNDAFGSYGIVIDGVTSTMPNNQHDRGSIVAAPRKRDHLLRLHVAQ